MENYHCQSKIERLNMLLSKFEQNGQVKKDNFNRVTSLLLQGNDRNLALTPGIK
jgi:hypothetical protein